MFANKIANRGLAQTENDFSYYIALKGFFPL